MTKLYGLLGMQSQCLNNRFMGRTQTLTKGYTHTHTVMYYIKHTHLKEQFDTTLIQFQAELDEKTDIIPVCMETMKLKDYLRH